VTVATVLGAPIRVHWLWMGLLLVLVLLGQGWMAVLAAAAVLIHELAHVAVARSLGYAVTAVHLTPYGGRADIVGLEAGERAPEALVALAGPAVSLLVGLAADVVAASVPGVHPLLTFFVEANAGLGFLNLLPAAPLDGGRLWRSLRAGRVGYHRARDEVRRWGIGLSLTAAAVALVAAAFGQVVWQFGVLAALLAWPLRDPDRGALWPVRDLAVRAAWFRARPVWGVADYAAREDAAVRDVLHEMRPLRLHRIAVLSVDQEYLGTLWERELLAALEASGPGTRLGSLISRQN
jgi:stage IV sporulation protein FB